MSAVFDRYLKEALLNLAPRTQRDYRGYIENLRKSFGEASPQEVTANSIFDYRAARARQGALHRERFPLELVPTHDKGNAAGQARRDGDPARAVHLSRPTSQVRERCRGRARGE